MDYNKAIPSIDFILPSVSYKESDEPLVDLLRYNSGRISVEPAYYLKGIKSAVSTCLARESVAEKLCDISEGLPDGLCLKVFDAWRPFEVQEALYYQYRDIVKKENAGLCEREIDLLTQQFVSLPEKNRYNSPVHSTGGAIDLTLSKPDGTELSMGTEFDAFSPESHTAFYEDKNSADALKIKANRRILYNAMINAGFTNLPTEWWHYDYGDKFWAHYTDNTAIYTGIF